MPSASAITATKVKPRFLARVVQRGGSPATGIQSCAVPGGATPGPDEAGHYALRLVNVAVARLMICGRRRVGSECVTIIGVPSSLSRLKSSMISSPATSAGAVGSSARMTADSRQWRAPRHECCWPSDSGSGTSLLWTMPKRSRTSATMPGARTSGRPVRQRSSMSRTVRCRAGDS